MTELRKIALIGVGNMGAPMAAHLVRAAERLVLFDLDVKVAEERAAAIGAEVADRLSEAAEDCDLVVTMLPNAEVVRAVLLDEAGLASALPRGAIVVDMSSSYPPATRETGALLAERGLTLLDAPVSGGVKKAVSGELAIMLGGDEPAALERAEPALATMGKVFRTGPLGSGHALKALNNFVSAAGLAAACEAILVGERFGLDPAVMIQVINASTGRNNATEVKFEPFILNRDFGSGFALDLMSKDLKAAADLASSLDLAVPHLQLSAELWAEAKAALGPGADHTEIFRYLETRAGA
ncbi:MAG: NAD(P)-dependent oxidoreductase [Rhodospirillales bacterium]